MMVQIHPALQISLAALATSAAVTDWRFRRIPNALAFGGLILGFLLNSMLDGGTGLLNSLQGFGLALLVYIPLFLLRAMGGGDVKLMAALGSMAGAQNWLMLFALASIIGGIHAVTLLLWRGSMGTAVRNSGRIASTLIQGRLPFRQHPELDIRHQRALSVPHAISVAAGTFLLLFASHRMVL